MSSHSKDRKHVEKIRYRKVSTRMYGDEKFQALSVPKPSGQGLWQYLITGPHTTAVPGLFIAGELGLSEALKWTLIAFRRCWQEIARQGMAEADWNARLVWLPNAIRHNLPESPNVVTGWKPHLIELPACPLRDRALWHIFSVLETVGESGAYAKAFREVMPSGVAKRVGETHEGFKEGFVEAFLKDTEKPSAKPSPNQEQEQDLPPNPPEGVLTPDQVGDLSRTFLERYIDVYAKCRHGAFYRHKEARDHPTALQLVTTYPDTDRLCRMLEIFLKRRDIRNDNVPGSINQFARYAPDCDAKLREFGQ